MSSTVEQSGQNKYQVIAWLRLACRATTVQCCTAALRSVSVMRQLVAIGCDMSDNGKAGIERIYLGIVEGIYQELRTKL